MSRPARQTPVEKFPALQERFNGLKKLRQAHLDVGREMVLADGGTLYATDLVIAGLLKRSLDLLDSITTLVERWNFTASASLLRLQLDSLLKLRYLAILTDPDAVSMEILGGHSLQKMKDKDGNKLTDARLRDYTRSEYPWIDEVYRETSKLVHFSEKHIFSTVQSLDKESRIVDFFIGEGFPNWSEQDIASLIDVMEVATKALLELVAGWTGSKQYRGKGQERGRVFNLDI